MAAGLRWTSIYYGSWTSISLCSKDYQIHRTRGLNFANIFTCNAAKLFNNE